MSAPPRIYASMTSALLAYHEKFGHEPKEIRLAPRLYREFRDSLTVECDDFCGFPVRCWERIAPDGVVVI